MSVFRDFVERYEEAGRGNTAKTYACLLRKFNEHLGERGKKPSDFTVGDVIQYLRESNYSPKSQSDIIGCLKRFSKWYANSQVDTGNIREALRERQGLGQIQDMVRPKVPRRETRKALRTDELRLLINAIESRNASYLYLTAYFGMRPSEWGRIEQIDWSQGELTVLTAKTDRERILPFNNLTRRALRKAAKRNWLDRSYSSIYRGLKSYRHLLEGVKLTPHSPRHTFESEMRRRVDDGIVNTLMGHSPKSIQDVYDSPAIEHLRRAMREEHYLAGFELPERLI